MITTIIIMIIMTSPTSLLQEFDSSTSARLSCTHSSGEERRCSQRQQKALSSTVRRLSESLKQLQQENAALREELDTDSPAGGMKGAFSHSQNNRLGLFLFTRDDAGSQEQNSNAPGFKNDTHHNPEHDAHDICPRTLNFENEEGPSLTWRNILEIGLLFCGKTDIETQLVKRFRNTATPSSSFGLMGASLKVA